MQNITLSTVLLSLLLIVTVGCASVEQPQSNPAVVAKSTAVNSPTERATEPEPTAVAEPTAVQSEPAAAQQQYEDPFAYCAAVGTIDEPNEQYSGSNMPDAIRQGMVAQGMVTADAPLEIQENGVWRCLDGDVWVCHFGANLPCLAKADLSKTPAPALADFCRENPTAESIPAVVTGRATVYAWGCEQGEPVVLRQLFEPDAQGYLADFWHQISEDGVVVASPEGVPTVVEAENGRYEPLPLAACQTIQERANQTLATTFTLAASDTFVDPNLGDTGLGCSLTATGTGDDFSDHLMVVMELVNAFDDWTDQLAYQAGGPTGSATGMTKDGGLMLIYAGWEPAPDAECPSDQPIAACELEPEQKLYTIQIQVAQHKGE